MEQSNVFDNSLGTVEMIKIEKQVNEMEEAHKKAVTPKKTLSDMMQQGRFDNIKN